MNGFIFIFIYFEWRDTENQQYTLGDKLQQHVGPTRPREKSLNLYWRIFLKIFLFAKEFCQSNIVQKIKSDRICLSFRGEKILFKKKFSQIFWAEHPVPRALPPLGGAPSPQGSSPLWAEHPVPRALPPSGRSTQSPGLFPPLGGAPSPQGSSPLWAEHPVPRALPPSGRSTQSPGLFPPLGGAPSPQGSPPSGRSTQSPGLSPLWAEHSVPRALPPLGGALSPQGSPPSGRSTQSPGLSPLWAEHLVPRAKKKINELTLLLTCCTYILCFVAFFGCLLTSGFCNTLCVFLLYFFYNFFFLGLR